MKYIYLFLLSLRQSFVRDLDDERTARPRPATNSPRNQPFRFPLKYLAAAAVALVNAGAMIYILVKVLAAVRGFLEAN